MENNFMELKLTREIKGMGDRLYVVVKQDADNFQGLWYGNNIAHVKEQMLEEWDEEEHANMLETYDNEYEFYQIGELKPLTINE